MTRLWSTRCLALLLDSTLAHPTQQPLSPPNTDRPANYTRFELRRYGISNQEDLVHMMDLSKKANIDIWHLGPDHVDIHMDTGADQDLLGRRYTTLPYSFPYNYNYTHPAPRPAKQIDVSRLQDNEFHDVYHTYAEIDQFVVALASEFPKLVEVVWLGASWEKRDVFAIRIGKRGRGNHRRNKKHRKHKSIRAQGSCHKERLLLRTWRWVTAWINRVAELAGLISNPTSVRDLYAKSGHDATAQGRRVKNRVVIQGAQHAREWIATSTALYLAHALVAPKHEPGSLRYLLDDFDFTIIPVPNPDGYDYTWTTDRLWYKNRMQLHPNPKSADDCRGVDMNRNWGYQWSSDRKNSSASEDPCSHWYPGAFPFQSPEVAAIANYIRRTPKIRAFIDLRSYGQQLMYPYSYSCEQVPPHAEDLIEAALGATKALRQTHNVPYTSGASCELLYPAPGNIIDWMYGESKVKYSYSLMLRDIGTYGFLLPPKQIRPVGEETAAAIQSLVHFIVEPTLRSADAE